MAPGGCGGGCGAGRSPFCLDVLEDFHQNPEFHRNFTPNLFPFLSQVVEDDEDDFPNTRTDGEFIHHNGSKDKCE